MLAELMRKHRRVEPVERQIAPLPPAVGIMKVPGVMAAYRWFNSIVPRHMSTDDVINELRPRLFTVPGILAFMQNPPPIQIGGQLTKSRYQFTLQGTETQQLYRESQRLLAGMSQLPALQDVNTDLQIANPQVNVEIDRDKASAVGVTAFQVEDALASAYGDRQVSTIYRPENDYMVITEGLYMFPRRDGILLGGTFQHGVWSLDVDEEARRRIVTGHRALFDGMR